MCACTCVCTCYCTSELGLVCEFVLVCGSGGHVSVCCEGWHVTVAAVCITVCGGVLVHEADVTEPVWVCVPREGECVSAPGTGGRKKKAEVTLGHSPGLLAP